MNWIQQNAIYLRVRAHTMSMALTRSDHFGSVITLPDASLAVFYLAGIFTGGMASFAVLLTATVLLAYPAITYGQVSDYCISPAYVFLMPTYALMLFAGRWSAKYASFSSRDLSHQFGYLLLATSLCLFNF